MNVTIKLYYKNVKSQVKMSRKCNDFDSKETFGQLKEFCALLIAFLYLI